MSPCLPLSLSTVPLGVLLTLTVRGYRFGESNHAVYLVDAVRRIDPSLLRNDWWANSTLQYHFVFNAITAALMRAGVLAPAFFVGYLLLALLLHVAWRRIVLRLGGNDGTYLLSVILFYLLVGGVGLGMYHFLQDSAFLPSNVANVAMLWGVYFWIAGLPASAGGCMGIAGLFHINHALAGIAFWGAASLLEGRRLSWRPWIVGTVTLLALSTVQIVPTLRVVLTRSGKLPLPEFVDLFVHLRHPHHFDPRAWHWGVWLSFLFPLPFAVLFRRPRDDDANADARRRAACGFAIFLAMIAIALLGAGFWFVSETLVQLNLYRFSIYPKLLSCVALAWFIRDRTPNGWAWSLWILGTFAGLAFFALAGWILLHLGKGILRDHPNLAVGILFTVLAVMSLVVTSPIPWRRSRKHLGVLAAAAAWVIVANRVNPLGIRVPGLGGDEPQYKSLAAWARDNTPTDAVFLVPPDEESFRVHARRAIVVNFKGVPQLSAELPEWRDRLEAVLDLDSRGLLALPRPLGRTLQAVRGRYDGLPAEHLVAVARRYGARYVVVTHALGPDPAPRLVHSDSNGHYFLYDLNPEP